MLAFVEVDSQGLAINADVQSAIDGLSYLGHDFRPITYNDLQIKNLTYGLQNGVAIGSIRFMKKVFSLLNCQVDDIDFPEELIGLQNRDIFRSTLGAIRKRNPSGFWIKPVSTKAFDAFPYSKNSDLNIVSEFSDDTEIWISPHEKIVSEWRCYIHNSELVWWGNYSGNFRIYPDEFFVKDLIRNWKTKPVACVIDVGIKKSSEGLVDCLIECGDFWAIGSYGLDSVKYAQMCIDRYQEIVKS